MRFRGWVLVLGLLAMPMVAMAQPFQGLYVGAGAGLYWPNDINVTTAAPTVPRIRIDPSLGFGVVGSIGYALGNGIRFEVEGNYRQADTNHGQGPGTPSFSGSLHTYGVMANALFDMDIGVPWVYPYLGAGVGYAWSHLDSFALAPTALPLGVVSASGTQGSFAFQGIAGLAFPIPNVPGLSLTAEYRFFGTTAQESFSGTVSPPGAPFPMKLESAVQQQLPVRRALCLQRCQTAARGRADTGSCGNACSLLSGILRLGQSDANRSCPPNCQRGSGQLNPCAVHAHRSKRVY